MAIKDPREKSHNETTLEHEKVKDKSNEKVRESVEKYYGNFDKEKDKEVIFP